MVRKPLYTAFLYSRPSLLSGMARLFDFWGFFDRYNSSPIPRAADAKAIYSDWRAVGSDLRRSVGSFAREKDSA
jgi:hypothetical protein